MLLACSEWKPSAAVGLAYRHRRLRRNSRRTSSTCVAQSSNSRGVANGQPSGGAVLKIGWRIMRASPRSRRGSSRTGLAAAGFSEVDQCPMLSDHQGQT